MKSTTLTSWLAVAACQSCAHAHIFTFLFGMGGSAVVPPTDSTAHGAVTFAYNHHTFNYDMELVITGVALEDLLDTGPNGTPVHIYKAPRGETGDIVLDPGYYGDFVQEGDKLRLSLSTIRLGGQQGGFSSSIFDNEQALYDGNLYIQLYTTQYPDGEIRGQLPPLEKRFRSEHLRGFRDTISPPTPIPAPAAPLAIAAAGVLATRRRR